MDNDFERALFRKGEGVILCFSFSKILLDNAEELDIRALDFYRCWSENLAVMSLVGHFARSLPAICLQAEASRINGGESIGLGGLSSAEL